LNDCHFFVFNVECDPSQYGAIFVCLHMHSHTFRLAVTLKTLGARPLP
jgi:hypothetical protein